MAALFCNMSGLSKIRHEDFLRPLFVRMSRSGYPPWILKRGGLESSGQIASSYTLYSSESIWPPPFSTRVYRNEEPSPEWQRDKEILRSQFISSLFEGVGQLLPGYFAGLLMCRTRLLAASDSCCQKVLQRFSGSIQGASYGIGATIRIGREMLCLPYAGFFFHLRGG